MTFGDFVNAAVWGSLAGVLCYWLMTYFEGWTEQRKIVREIELRKAVRKLAECGECPHCLEKRRRAVGIDTESNDVRQVSGTKKA